MSEPWFDPNALGGTLGAIIGILGGVVYGPLTGSCSPRGKLKGLVLGYHFALLAGSVGLVAAGGYAHFAGQPWEIWCAFVLAGLIGVFVFGGLTPVLLKRYRDAELAQEQEQNA